MPRYAFNSRRKDLPTWASPEMAFVEAIRKGAQLPFHRLLPGYEPTPLLDLPELARELGVGGLAVKDEAGRFGLKAFKGLGASYAVYSVLRERWRDITGTALDIEAFGDREAMSRLGAITLTAATDGNHGRAVAWTARCLGQGAVIFVPEGTATSRIAAITGEGAEVREISGTFDDCVEECARTAAREGWQVIADTAYEGYLEVPGAIMTGYSTIFAEIAAQTDRRYDVVLLPAGVGGLAAAGIVDLVQRFGAARPQVVCVEPEESACFLESIEHDSGEPIAARGNQQSLMVGLCCGQPSLLAWPILRDGGDLFLAIEDRYALDAMRAYHRHGVVAGESGASSLAGLLALLATDELAPARLELGLDGSSQILVLNTEGATDPEHHAAVIAEESAP